MAENNLNVDIEKLKELNPEDRLKKLKEIEEKIKREMASLEEINKQTKREVKEEKEKKLLEMAPKQEDVHIEDLFKGEENLETQVKRENKENSNNNQPTYLLQKLEKNKQVVGNILTETYNIREFIDKTVSKYNPNLGDRLNKELFSLANELKSLYEHKINK